MDVPAIVWWLRWRAERSTRVTVSETPAISITAGSPNP